MILPWKKLIFNDLKLYVLYLIGSTIIMLLYTETAHFWQELGYGHISGHIFKTEIFFWLFILTLFYIPVGKLSFQIMIGTMPLLVLYLFFDLFYSFLARSPVASDLKNFQLISDFSPLMMFGILLLITITLGSIGYAVYIYCRKSGKSNCVRMLGIRTLLLIGFVWLLQTSLFGKIMEKNFKYYCWSQTKTIKKNGRISSFFYYGMLEKKASQKLQKYCNIQLKVNKVVFGDTGIIRMRNIYMVVLESFIDPRLIENVQFDRSPLAEEMRKYLADGNFFYVKSPVYGGATSQAEFELLTGVRALAKVNSIEFNTLRDHQISGFVHMLKQNGYYTYATIGTNSQYYNAKTAYGAIGFDKIVFLEEEASFGNRKKNVKIFDGVLYRYVLEKIDQGYYIHPHFIYVLGMYGHFPYQRDMQLQPDVINVTYHDERVRKIANQFYYRTRALALFIDHILEKDSDAVIYISSDHLPPLLDKNIKFAKDKYTNIALLLVGGKPVDINGLHYFEIPRLLISILREEKLLRQKHFIFSPEVEEKLYYKILSESLQ